MVYFYRGYNTSRLKKVVSAVTDKMGDEDHEIILNNGEGVEVYGKHNNWLVVDAEDREHEIHDDYEMAILLIQMARL